MERAAPRDTQTDIWREIYREINNQTEKYVPRDRETDRWR